MHTVTSFPVTLSSSKAKFGCAWPRLLFVASSHHDFLVRSGAEYVFVPFRGRRLYVTPRQYQETVFRKDVVCLKIYNFTEDRFLLSFCCTIHILYIFQERQK